MNKEVVDIKRRAEELRILSENTSLLFQQDNTDDILRVAGEIIFEKLGYVTTILTLEDNYWHLKYISIPDKTKALCRKLTGLDPNNFKLESGRIDSLNRLENEKKPFLLENSEKSTLEAINLAYENMDGAMKYLTKGVSYVLNIISDKLFPYVNQRIVSAPIIAGENLLGEITVIGNTLTEEDIPTISHFAQILAVVIERKKNEIELKRSEEKLRSLIDNAPNMIMIVNRDGSIQSINRTVEGFSAEDIIDAKVYDFIYPAHHDKVKATIENTFLNGEIGSYEVLGAGPNGANTWYESNVGPILRNGEIIAATLIVSDITERKKIEDRLVMLNAMFLQLTHDYQHNVGICTRTCGELLGATYALYNKLSDDTLVSTAMWNTPEDFTTRDEPEGHICYDVIRSGDKKDIFTVNDLPATKYAETDSNVKKYGLKTYCGYPVTCFGETIGSLCVIFTDNTKLNEYDKIALKIIAKAISNEEERKRVDESLSKSEEQFRTLVNNSPVAIFRSTPGGDGKLSLVNPAYVELFRYDSMEEAAAMTVASNYVDPAQRERFSKKLRSRGRVIGEKLLLKRKDGSPFYASLSARVIENQFTGEVFFEGMIEDITERINAENQLMEYAGELEQRNEEIRNFAYIVSHDLRTPLINITGFAGELRSMLEVLQAQCNAVSANLSSEDKTASEKIFHDEIPMALGFIESSVKSMGYFIDAILKLSRMGHMELRLKLLDMNELVSSALDNLSHSIKERNIEVTVTNLPNIEADKTAIEQIVANLLSNAVLYLDPARPGKIEISGISGKKKTIFHIKDNGRGISDEDRKKVFAPFRRAVSQDIKGEGMGLAYVRTMVRRHNGNIWFESEPGKGAVFSFSIMKNLREVNTDDRN